MTTRDKQRLRGVHPALVAAIESVVDEMAALGHPIFVAQGLRTTLQQQALYAQGRTAKGPIVTNANGVTTKSNHQAKPDGYGHAVDLAFTDPEPFAERHPWTELGLRAEAHGLKWGGRWTKFQDRPHVELPTEFPGMLTA